MKAKIVYQSKSLKSVLVQFSVVNGEVMSNFSGFVMLAKPAKREIGSEIILPAKYSFETQTSKDGKSFTWLKFPL